MPPHEKEQAPIKIETLDPQQLFNLKERVENDLQQIASGAISLQRVISAFENSAKAIETLAASSEGQFSLIPMTSSLYVSANLTDVDHVLIDIGTGYFVEMTSGQGIDHFKTKTGKLRQNVDGIEGEIREKQNILFQINSVLNEKVQKMQAQQASTSQ